MCRGHRTQACCDELPFAEYVPTSQLCRRPLMHHEPAMHSSHPLALVRFCCSLKRPAGLCSHTDRDAAQFEARCGQVRRGSFFLGAHHGTGSALPASQ